LPLSVCDRPLLVARGPATPARPINRCLLNAHTNQRGTERQCSLSHVVRLLQVSRCPNYKCHSGSSQIAFPS
jgi:hypothetical protein